MLRSETENRSTRAPADLGRVARVINREVQEEVTKDAFGAEVTHRLIKMQILEVESKKQGAWEDLAAVEEDNFAKDFLENMSRNSRLYG